MAYTEAQIIAIGGSLWEGTGKRRIYLNDLHALWLASGRQALSRSKRMRLADDVRSIYLDCQDGKIAITGRDGWDGALLEGIAALVAELPALEPAAKPEEAPVPEVPQAAAPFTWITPALVLRYADDDRMGPGGPGSSSALRALLPQMIDEAREDPASWPDQVAWLAARPWVWTLAVAAIDDGLPVSDEAAAKVASLRGQGLL